MNTAKRLFGAIVLWVSGGRVLTRTASREYARIRAERIERAREIQQALNREHMTKWGWYVGENHELITGKNGCRLSK